MFTYYMEGQFHFGFILFLLRLVSIFLNVSRVEISCGLLPTRFSTTLKGDISSSILEKNNLHQQKTPKKLDIRHLNGHPNFSHSL